MATCKELRNVNTRINRSPLLITNLIQLRSKHPVKDFRQNIIWIQCENETACLRRMLKEYNVDHLFKHPFRYHFCLSHTRVRLVWSQLFQSDNELGYHDRHFTTACHQLLSFLEINGSLWRHRFLFCPIYLGLRLIYLRIEKWREKAWTNGKGLLFFFFTYIKTGPRGAPSSRDVKRNEFQRSRKSWTTFNSSCFGVRKKYFTRKPDCFERKKRVL